MPRLLMYFPENDLALASGHAAYTPPPAALALHAAGEALPLWMASAGDRFVCTGISSRWLDRMRATFDIGDVDVYNHHDSSLEACPWGWSAASRRALIDAGYPASQLPSDTTLRSLRELSHRRTAARLAEHVRDMLPFAVSEAATEACDMDAVEAYLSTRQAVIAKAPWSCRGRWLVRSRNMPVSTFRQQVAGIIRRQGSVMLEPELDKIMDFALLFEADGQGEIEYRGISVFDTNAHGGYTGNIIAEQHKLIELVGNAAGTQKLAMVTEAVQKTLPRLISDYRGPLGVDMLVTADGTIDAAVEMNLRYTMGFVALGVSRYLAPGSRGTLCVVPRPDRQALPATIESHRIVTGELDLTPHNSMFAFRATVSCPKR